MAGDDWPSHFDPTLSLTSYNPKAGKSKRCTLSVRENARTKSSLLVSFITANTRCGNFFHAFYMFKEMMDEGLIPKEFTLGSLLKAISGLGDVWVAKSSMVGPAGICYANEAEVRALLFGFKWFANSKLGPLIVEGDSSNTIAWATKNSNGPWRLHNFVTEIRDLVSVIMPTIEHRRRSANEVVDQLAKDGVLREFMSIFIAPEMEGIAKNIIVNAISVFERMERRDVFSWPGMITGFGHDYESLNLFERMKAEGVKPNSFGRAEKLVETSIALIGTKWNFCLSLWRVLLGVCHARKQLELSVLAATRILEMEPEDEHTHILLANLYAAFGMWDDAVRVRRLMKDRGLKRDVGFSWIDIGSRRNIFIAGDVTQQNREAIYEKRAVHDVDESQKEAIISYYCE
ncbi:pentatricopeptide repeat-containing protein At2g03880, mitochondrial-like [Tasmannia lanceolata]|uniref:pentatricopeptide repeat-containing protein At2g03880, mitochondrial-like n=1 Tax=Tasmannia lanceolata TaxID=3420 RepID=UPI004064ADD7